MWLLQTRKSGGLVFFFYFTTFCLAISFLQFPKVAHSQISYILQIWYTYSLLVGTSELKNSFFPFFAFCEKKF